MQIALADQLVGITEAEIVAQTDLEVLQVLEIDADPQPFVALPVECADSAELPMATMEKVARVDTSRPSKMLCFVGITRVSEPEEFLL